MGIRVQPLEIEVPDDDPFRHDLLERQESVEVLTHLLSSIEGPCVFALDGAWGSGKSTFLKIWSKHLRGKQFPVVKFNAWETDYCEDPFIALSNELTDGLKCYSDESIEEEISYARACAIEIARRSIPGVIRVATAGIVDVSPLLADEIGRTLSSYAEQRLNAYTEDKNSLSKFRSSFEKMAVSVSDLKGGLPLVVMIDELDRCRPLYAVELLEVAKHLFSVDNIIFVLALNRPQLSHSIRAVYGQEFNATDYLKRFFNIEFRLPHPERSKFIKTSLQAANIKSYFERTRDTGARNDLSFVEEMLCHFFSSDEISIRQISQSIHHLGLVLGSLRSDKYSFTVEIIIALIIRTFDSEGYDQFCRGSITDKEILELVFRIAGAKVSRHVHIARVFEVAVIVSGQYVVEPNNIDIDPLKSPLVKQYRKVLDEGNQSGTINEKEVNHAKEVFDMVRNHRRIRGNGFMESIRRIELLSPGLIDSS